MLGLLAASSLFWGATAAAPSRIDAQTSDAAQAALLVEAGREAIGAGKVAAACEHFSEAVKVLPAWWIAQLEYARCGRLLGLPPLELLAHVDAALAVEPDKASLVLWKAHLLEDAGRKEDAAQAYERALALADWLEEPWQRLAALAESQQNWSEAARLYRRWGELHPNSAFAWVRLAAVTRSYGDLTAAADALERALPFSANRNRVLAELVRTYRELGRTSDAIRCESALRAAVGGDRVDP